MPNISKPMIISGTVIVCVALGCVTFLCYKGRVAGTDLLTLFTLVLTGVVGTVWGHVAITAALTPPPAQQMTLNGQLTSTPAAAPTKPPA